MSRNGNLQHEAEALGASLPPLLVEADRLAAAVSLGVHGRRKAGMGESFWQFRRYRPEDSSDRHRLAPIGQVAASVRARARMGSGADGVVLARRLARHAVRVRQRDESATAPSCCRWRWRRLLVRGGERVALFGDGHAPASSRAALRRIGHTLARPGAKRRAPAAGRADHQERAVRLVQRFSLAAGRHRGRRCAACRASAVAGHLVHIIDPAEEDFPFTGRTRFEDARGATERNHRPRRDRSPAPIAPASRPMAKRSARWRGGWAGPASPIAPTVRRRPRWSRSMPT